MRKLAVASMVAGTTLIVLAVIGGPVFATPPVDGVHKVDICHRTNSVTNPYVLLNVDADSVDLDTGNDQGQGDHNAEHNGPVFDPANPPPPPHNGDQWGDIIPPFFDDGSPGTWPAKNWDAAGMVFFANDCNISVTTTTTTTSPPTTTTTTTPPVTTTTTTPPVTTTPPPVHTTPPPATTTVPPTTTTTAPPPAGIPPTKPPKPPKPPQAGPPPTTAFTGPEDVARMAELAAGLFLIGTSLVLFSRKKQMQ